MPTLIHNEIVTSQGRNYIWNSKFSIL